MIRDLDARVLADQTLTATLYLEGDQTATIRGKFQKAGAEAAAWTIQSGITGHTETIALIHEKPIRSGIRDLHELLQDQGAIDPVVTKWAQQIYPTLINRLAITH